MSGDPAVKAVLAGWRAAAEAAAGTGTGADIGMASNGAAAPAEPEARHWPHPPDPMSRDLLPVPAFDVDRLLPAAFAPWVRDIAERSQAPVDFVAVAALVGTAAVVGRQLAIRPKRHDNWYVVPNLWSLAVGRPGIMKSPALQEALKPLQRLVMEERDAHAARMADREFRVAKDKARKELLQKKLKKAIEDHQSTDDLQKEFQAAGYTEPVERRFMVNDSTVEKLGELLNQNPNGLLLFRDELAGFLRTMDREGHENDRAFYCEAWNGTGHYTYDRIARGTIHIEAACLSVLGGIQPGPLQAYLREVFGTAGDDGLIQRFQLMVFPDIEQTWRNVDRWPDTAAKNRASQIYQRLSTLDTVGLGAERDESTELPFLRFAPDAQARFDEWRGDLEQLLRRDDEHPVVLAHLAKYRSLLPSLALVFHLIDVIDHGSGGPVSATATARAVAWCTYLEAHARRVYQSVTDRVSVAAAMLAAKITNGNLTSPFTAREVGKKGWTGLTEKEDVYAALDMLEDLHWVQEEGVSTTSQGGRPTREYHIHPSLVLSVSAASGGGMESSEPPVSSVLSVGDQGSMGSRARPPRGQNPSPPPPSRSDVEPVNPLSRTAKTGETPTPVPARHGEGCDCSACVPAGVPEDWAP
jgi:putative DNA primase/helicase